jgi:probable rRNA maturation factor
MAKKRKSSPKEGRAGDLPQVRCGSNLHPGFPLTPRELSLFTGQLLKLLGLDSMHLEIRLVDDKEMARLNLAHLGIPGPTNVLSFPLGEEGPSGLVVLSMDAVLRESFLYGQSPLEQMTRLLAHALLHLAGFDHGHEMDMLTERAVERFQELAAAV